MGAPPWLAYLRDGETMPVEHTYSYLPSGRGDYVGLLGGNIHTFGMGRPCQCMLRSHSYLQDGETTPVHAKIS